MFFSQLDLAVRVVHRCWRLCIPGRVFLRDAGLCFFSEWTVDT